MTTAVDASRSVSNSLSGTLPLRLVVTGDTHFRSGNARIPEILVEQIGSADAIIHTGDFCNSDGYRSFADLGELIAVRGNNEASDLSSLLPPQVSLDAGSYSICVTHGHLERGRSAKDAVVRAYAGRHDIVIFGHSHQPYWEEVQGTWFLNPGSPTMKRREPQFSFAVLEIPEDDPFRVSFFYFDMP